MADLDWLIARPVAHRGLHDAAAGVIENMPSAFAAAIAGRYAIECDLQVSADGEAMVHHDATLGRLSEGRGELRALTAADLKRVTFRATTDRMITLGELCDLAGGRVPLVIELKGRFDAEPRLAARTADVLRGYGGPAAVMSFDPRQVEALRAAAPDLPRGIVAERWYDDPEWASLTSAQKYALGNLLHGFRTQPHFIAYYIQDLPAVAPLVARYLFGLPLLTWTVRTTEEQQCAARWASQMIFEGFRP